MSNRNLSLAQHLAAGQLPMFMTGNEIKEHYKIGDYEHHISDTTKALETDVEVWDRKEKSAHKYNYKDNGAHDFNPKTSLAQDILKEGVKNPVEIHEDGRIAEGHHRIAVMAKNNPKGLIPIKHLEY